MGLNKFLKRNAALVVAMSVVTNGLVVEAHNFTMVAQQRTNEQDKVKGSFESVLNDNQTSEVITFKTEELQENITIKAIMLPDGTRVEEQDVTVEVTSNGSYDFTVEYEEVRQNDQSSEGLIPQEVEMTSPPALEVTPPNHTQTINGTQVFTYEVTKIVEELEVEQKSQPGVKMSIEGYSGGVVVPIGAYKGEEGTEVHKVDNYNGQDYDPDSMVWQGDTWEGTATKKVTIEVVFDQNSTDRTVEFTLPEGMEFNKITVPFNYNAGSVDPSILVRLPNDDHLGESIKAVDIPVRESGYGESTYGTVKYTFDEAVQSTTLEFQVSVDHHRYYGKHLVDYPITVKASEKNKADEMVVYTDDEIPVFLTGKLMGDITSLEEMLYMTEQWNKVDELVPSTAAVPVSNRTDIYNVSRGTIFKEIQVQMHYPAGMLFEQLYLQPRTIRDIEKDDASGTYTFTYDHHREGKVDHFLIRYKVPEATLPGIHTTEGRNLTVTYIAYDGTVLHAEGTHLEPESILVWDPNELGTIELETDKIDTLYNRDGVESHTGYFRVENNTPATTNPYWFHVEFDPNFYAKKVVLPFDELLSNNTIGKVYYKTNKSNGEFMEADSSVFKHSGNNTRPMRTFEASAVGLEADEYFTEIKVDMGRFSPGFKSNHQGEGEIFDKHPNYAFSYGQVNEGVETIVNTITMWSDQSGEDRNNDTPSDTQKTHTTEIVSNVVLAEGMTTASNSSVHTIVIKGEDGNVSPEQSKAYGGDTVEVTVDLKLFILMHGTTTAVKDPIVYLRELDSIRIIEESIKLNGETLGADAITGYTLDNGQDVYKVNLPETLISGATDYPIISKEAKISFAFEVDKLVSEQDKVNINEMIAWTDYTNSVRSVEEIEGNPQHMYKDLFDIDQNGIKEEVFLGVASREVPFAPAQGFMVDTFIGEYDERYNQEGDYETLTKLTAGEAVNYTINIRYNEKNTEDKSPYEGYTMYVPIPKEGKDLGSIFHGEIDENKPGTQTLHDKAFEWSMNLTESVRSSEDVFTITYATGIDESNFENAEYKDISAFQSNLDAIEMIKISANIPIKEGDSYTITVPMAVSEGRKVRNIQNDGVITNVYRPLHTFTYKGSNMRPLDLEVVGVEIQVPGMGPISGKAYYDVNANGIYDEGEQLLKGVEVALLELNEQTKEYEALIDKENNPIVATTDEKGTYSFDYTHGIEFGTYAIQFGQKDGEGNTYEFTKSNVGDDDQIDSDAQHAGSRIGLAEGIDPTNENARYISAGYIKENDLEVNQPPIITAEDITITVGDKFDPLDHVTAYDPEGGEVSIRVEGTVDTSIAAEYDIKYIAIDPQGLVAEKTITVTVVEKEVQGPPILEYPEVIYIEEDELGFAITVENLGITATDYKGVDITDKIVITSGLKEVIELGTYEVTFEVTDSNGNKATGSMMIVVLENSETEEENEEDQGQEEDQGEDENQEEDQDTIRNTKPVVYTKDITIFTGDSFDPILYAQAYDKEDGVIEITKSHILENNVDVTVAGVYTVKYQVIDQGGLKSDIEVMTVHVIDPPSTTNPPNLSNAPVITAEDVVIDQYVDFNPLDYAKAYDKEDGELVVEVVQNRVDTAVLGTYRVVYRAVDSHGNETIKEIYVTVIGKEKPPIQNQKPIVIAENVVVLKDSIFDPLDHAVGHDEEDGSIDIGLNDVISNTVNTQVVGRYEVTYRIVDSEGLVSDDKTITVTVIEPQDNEVDIDSGSSSGGTEDKEEDKEEDKIITGNPLVDAFISAYGFGTSVYPKYTSGYPDGEFKSLETTTRGEFVQMVARILLNGGQVPEVPNLYSDVSETYFAYNAINFLTQAEILTGYEDGTFRPQDSITRAEIAAILARINALGVPTLEVAFEDLKETHWAYEEIQKVANKGWLIGYEDITFKPNQEINRAETVAALNRIYRTGYTFDQTAYEIPFLDVPTTYWGYEDILKSAVTHIAE